MSLAAPNPREFIGANSPPLSESLALRHADILAEVDPIEDRAASLPARIDNDIALGRLADVVKDANKLAKRLDSERTTEVEPHLTAQREINAFFKAVSERLERTSRRLEQLATDYQRAKIAEQRRADEERARRLREEEERQRRIAEDAAAKNRAATALKHDDRADEAAENARRAEAAAKASAADLSRIRSASGTVATTRTTWAYTIDDIEKIPLEKLRPYLSRDAIEKAISAYVRINKGSSDLAGVRIFQDDKAAFR